MDNRACAPIARRRRTSERERKMNSLHLTGRRYLPIASNESPKLTIPKTTHLL